MTIRLNGSVSTIAIVLAASFLGIAPAFAAEQEAAKKPLPEQKAAAPKQKTGEDEEPAAETILTGTAIRGVATPGSNPDPLASDFAQKPSATDVSDMVHNVLSNPTAGAGAQMKRPRVGEEV